MVWAHCIEAIAGEEIDNVGVSFQGAGGGHIHVALVHAVGGLRQEHWDCSSC
jgi:hypothetical protein